MKGLFKERSGLFKDFAAKVSTLRRHLADLKLKYKTIWDFDIYSCSY